MGVTNFPNGLSNAGTASQTGLTAVAAGAGTVTTTLDSVSHIVCSLAGVPGTAVSTVFTAAGTAHVNATAASSFILKTYQYSGAAGTATASVAWTAYGAKS